jgi:hypothetical protein
MQITVDYNPVSAKAKKITETKIQVLEAAFLQQEQVECSVVHRFGPNIYIREVTIPAGTLSIGHYQTTTHLNVMLTGRVTMIDENGGHTELIAPHTFVSGPGRKIGQIHEKMIWQNIYATNETDVEKLESMFIRKSQTWQEDQKNQQLALSFNRSADVADYYAAISEYGFSHETVQNQVQNLADQTDMPYGAYKMNTAESNLDGKGVFATGNIEANEIIAPARIKGKRTPAGRFVNHAKNPNAKMVLLPNGDVDLVALGDITGCKGGRLGDEITINYRQALNLVLKGD